MSADWGVVASPIVPGRRPEPSTRAGIERYRRQIAAARVRRRSPVAAAEIESEAAQFGRHWQASLRNSEQIAARQRAEAEIWRQVDALREEEDFYERRAAAHMAQDRAAFRAAWRAGR